MISYFNNRFYYDFYVPGEQISESDLKKIKKEMDKIIKKDLPLIREEVTREEARYCYHLLNISFHVATFIQFFIFLYNSYRRRIEELNEPYKLEILDSIKTEPITIYHVGDEWWDLCAGPHVKSTGSLVARSIDLLSIAGAYWRGDEKNAMLQVNAILLRSDVSCTPRISVSLLSALICNCSVYMEQLGRRRISSRRTS